jgi:hypothetical protein
MVFVPVTHGGEVDKKLGELGKSLGPADVKVLNASRYGFCKGVVAFVREEDITFVCKFLRNVSATCRCRILGGFTVCEEANVNDVRVVGRPF